MLVVSNKPVVLASVKLNDAALLLNVIGIFVGALVNATVPVVLARLIEVNPVRTLKSYVPDDEAFVPKVVKPVAFLTVLAVKVPAPAAKVKTFVV